jgi:hypothetical protein
MEGSGQLQCIRWFYAVRVSVGQVDMCRKLVCVCVCVAGIRTDRTSVSLMNGLIRVVIFQPNQNPHSAARSVHFPFHLEKPISHFWLSPDAVNKASCNHCQNAVQEQRLTAGNYRVPTYFI